MQVEISPTEATFTRQAISEALRAVPWIFDEEQREALSQVDNRLCDATDEAFAKAGP